MNKLTKISLAALAGVALSAGSFASVANAAPDIPAGQTGVIDVHKIKGVPSDVTNDGTEQNVPGDPLEGIKFDVYQVEGVDVTTNDGAKIASALGNMQLSAAQVEAGKVSINGSDYTLKLVKSINTDAKGNARFESLPLGLYVVNEDLAGSTPVGVEKDAVSPAAPFAVALPFTNPADQASWLFEADVYPKNQVNSVVKAVTDAGVREGQEFTYTLTATPMLGDSNGDGKIDAADIGHFEFLDKLPTGVSFVSASASINGADATLTDDFTATDGADGVSVAFTQAGIEKIAKGGEVKVELKVKLDKINPDGLAKNTVTLFPNQYSKDQGKGIPSNEVVTKHGDIVIHKVDGAETTKNLAGAVFTVHMGKDAGCADYDKTAIATSEPTNDQGLTSIAGLQLSNWVNDAAADNTYCLVETKAPTGYQLLPKATPFQLTAAGTVTDLSAAPDGSKIQIENHKNLGLPLTGGAGIGLLSAAGVVALGGGLTVGLRNSRRNKKN
ncbi:fimbrial isopeptide formation D2 domain-containing protein [Propionimicrobium lymphophilum ACS-093-V-SCH5]|uniref:Fimbrial isopeptide formation D2 domain-containing protein n=1 Tax=Propionimicrobium lymphophilum ACS-093-V-SCH5 TaxID=883161 RepID=S2VZH9_9ACTN|nr:SpaH/EbpB family LPXTG-anchored major pilin [Propionimicrobium lymphophilum]EPD32938.1 fimbrial isopeptide formation D2 domain-containing protein [Propionimicrobium lymphophilum ACS-093-V-SCH5]